MAARLPASAGRRRGPQLHHLDFFGTNLVAQTGAATAVPLPTDINGTRGSSGSRAAPLFYVSAKQINAQLPWSVSAGTLPLTVTTARGSSAPVNVAVVDTAPGLFSQPTSGRGPGAIQNLSLRGTRR